MNKSALARMIQATGGGGWVLEDAPDRAMPETAMSPIAAMRMVEQELILDGIPERNLATFVTTWMEPEAQRLIGLVPHGHRDHGGGPAGEPEPRLAFGAQTRKPTPATPSSSIGCAPSFSYSRRWLPSAIR